MPMFGLVTNITSRGRRMRITVRVSSLLVGLAAYAGLLRDDRLDPVAPERAVALEDEAEQRPGAARIAHARAFTGAGRRRR